MGQSKKKANRRTSNWSELCPDLLGCVFKRLSFMAFNRAISVCSSWHSASRHCVPIRNQMPWLILFPSNEESNNNNNIVFFVPDDEDKVYRCRHAGVDFVQSRCLRTCGSWLLILSPFWDLYILNPLTGERIDLPDTRKFRRQYDRACFLIDSKTKDYLVVIIIQPTTSVSLFTKKGDTKGYKSTLLGPYKDFVYNPKKKKLYIHETYGHIDIWDLSEDDPRKDGHLDSFRFNHSDFPSWFNEELYWDKLYDYRTRIVLTVSGDVLIVASIVTRCNTWQFRIYNYKPNHVMDYKWVKLDSLGDEALIYDMGVTVVANGIPGIKRNSIYFSGVDHGTKDPHNIFVYDLTTQKMEPLPQCVFSSLRFSDARWFFP
ncbi:putative F-box protein [Cardamine amara subsp. amara]|uniref:F-box protein n=1 Tax=Cardamine amara subsp. amara TaxID=228776 RepID=A0ABD1AX65_CARAN